MNIELSKYNVLVVEDSEINLYLLQRILEEEYETVFLAPDARIALEILENNKVDLILMDVMMGEMNGFELTQKLKSMERYSEIPILFLTSLDSPEDIVKGFDLGGVDYITKPFNRLELLRRVKHQIQLVDSYNTILRQKEELQVAIDNRDRLYAIMAHDLRTPISSLKMIFNILSMKVDDPTSRQQYLDVLYTGNDVAEQLFCMLDNFLKWTKSNLGLLTMAPQELKLNQTIEGIVETVAPTAKLRNITFDLQLDQDVDIFFDLDVMNSILRNLLINAEKFSRPNSSIVVKLKDSSNEITVEVIDSGIGMTKDVQEKLRNRFTAKEDFASTSIAGKGLGLWIVYYFVNLNHGLFFFESEENIGSKFGFTIPKKSPLGN
ncbi:hybrid sensor histidine kinase/response regulator [Sphingobacterium rhinopitheci]|uniref:hybrid sensor histidine kinase/response regulator n=1 Tax=Sphingobacterium rhinopitheci TaxID=2781960 RepID=UPI001F518D71|nr:hybrid sensor histidine kinase/response regulator [Sphingobacterium rhinopitheci]MCI0920528.1 hybrid sensor histidine kinase/response regulator [Sphingobacterium rhinopitheci]